MVIISTTILVKSDSTFPLSYISVGIFFVNTAQAEPGRNSRSRLSFFFCLAARVRGLLRKNGAYDGLIRLEAPLLYAATRFIRCALAWVERSPWAWYTA